MKVATVQWVARMKCRHCGSPWEYDWEFCPECHRNYGGAIYPATRTDEELRDAERLARQIHGAFAGVTLGSGLTIHQAHLEGCYWDESARRKDPETNWTEVPAWKLESGSSTLSFLDPEGWRFYIPAFMCWTLKNWRTSDSITADAVFWNLALSDEHWTKRYELLDRVQAEAIYDFLDHFDRHSGEDDAGKAIQAYWHQFRKT